MYNLCTISHTERFILLHYYSPMILRWFQFLLLLLYHFFYIPQALCFCCKVSYILKSSRRRSTSHFSLLKSQCLLTETFLCHCHGLCCPVYYCYYYHHHHPLCLLHSSLADSQQSTGLSDQVLLIYC